MSDGQALDVHGGARGSVVTYEALLRCARSLSLAADLLLGLASRVGCLAADPALLLAGPVAPGPAARAQTSIARAAADLFGCGLRVQARAGHVGAAVLAYRAADRLARRPGEQGPQVAGGTPPRLLDHVLDGVDVLVPGGVGGAARLLARVYPGGAGRAASPLRSRSEPSRTLSDLLTALAGRERAAAGPRQGEVELRRVTTTGRGGGTRTAWVVLLPGTRDWQLDPRRREHLNDLRTSLELLDGGTGARLDALGAALDAAGAAPDEPLLLVGHSQGGLLAAVAAARWSAEGGHRVTHVLTTGAPTGRVVLPSQVQLLSLENRGDPVPRLDGARNPATPSWTTVGFDAGAAAAARPHSLEAAYLPLARHLEDEPSAGSVRAWVAGADDFLAADDELVRVERFVVDLRLGPERPR